MCITRGTIDPSILTAIEEYMINNGEQKREQATNVASVVELLTFKLWMTLLLKLLRVTIKATYLSQTLANNYLMKKALITLDSSKLLK